MASLKDVNVHHLVLFEYRAKQDATKAVKNIRKKFGPNAITKSEVVHLFKQFNKDGAPIYNKRFNSLATNEMFSKAVNSLLFQSEKPNLKGKLITTDGRLTLCTNFDSPWEGRNIIIGDLFHAKFKNIQINSVLFSPNACFRRNCQVEIINDEYLMLFRPESNQIALLEVDYENWKVKVHGPYKLNEGQIDGIFMLDRNKKQRFAIFSPRGSFTTGRVEDDFGITVEKFGQMNFGCLQYVKFEDGKLHGLKSLGGGADDEIFQTCEFDLETLSVTYSAPFSLVCGENEHFNLSPIYRKKYTWFESKLLVPIVTSSNVTKILSLDTERGIWKDTKITVFGSISGMFVDDQGLLTLKVTCDSTTYNFHRFSLRKADSLKNLAWLTMVRNSNLFESTIYDRIVNRLPYNTDLHCLL